MNTGLHRNFDFMPDILLVRADASSRMGTGHVMRCIALGQAWQDEGGKVVFATSGGPAGIEARLHAENMRLERIAAPAGSAEDASLTAALLESLSAPWIVVDGYHFDSAYQKTLGRGSWKVLWIDDDGRAAPYCTDLVLNQHIIPDEDIYSDRSAGTRLLLGTRHALLRREFQPWRGMKREICDNAEKILVTLGGSDPDNVTLKVIEGIGRLESDRLHARVIVGAANTHVDVLRRACDQSSIRIELKEDVVGMPELMSWADVAVSAGGTTCWELAFMGLPNLIVVLADNQRGVAEEFAKRGASVDLGWHESVSAQSISGRLASILQSRDTRLRMSAVGRALVDGEGAERVCKVLRDADYV